MVTIPMYILLVVIALGMCIGAACVLVVWYNDLKE